MNTQELLDLQKRCCDKAHDIMRRKNHDYSGEKRIFANFDRVEAMGICTVEQGFFVRMCDKFSRLITLSESGKNFVKDETVEDTVIDFINYPILYLAYKLDKQNQNQCKTTSTRCTTSCLPEKTGSGVTAKRGRSSRSKVAGISAKASRQSRRKS